MTDATDLVTQMIHRRAERNANKAVTAFNKTLHDAVGRLNLDSRLANKLKARNPDEFDHFTHREAEAMLNALKMLVYEGAYDTSCTAETDNVQALLDFMAEAVRE